MLLAALADTFRLLREPAFRLLGLLSVCLSLALLVAALAIVLLLFEWVLFSAGLNIPPVYDTRPLFTDTGQGLKDLSGPEGIAILLVASIGLMVPVAAAFGALSMDAIARRIIALRMPAPGMAPGLPPPGTYSTLKDSVNFTGMLVAANAGIVMITLFLSTVIGTGVLVLWYGVNGWLLGREYFTLAARRHLSAPELAQMRAASQGRIWFAGLLMALMLSLPVANLVVPFLGAAWFIRIFHRLNGVSRRQELPPAG